MKIEKLESNIKRLEDTNQEQKMAAKVIQMLEDNQVTTNIPILIFVILYSQTLNLMLNILIEKNRRGQ